MIKFIALRLIAMLVVLLAAGVLTFALSRMAGDPRNLYLTGEVTPEQYEAWGKEMGLDRPVHVQFFIWASRAATGDFGKSLRSQQPVTSVIWERVPATAKLATVSFVFAISVGIPLGMLSAIKRGSGWDLLGRGVALMGQSLPAFWTGLVLIMVFGVALGWLPVGREGDWRHYILPAITLGWGGLAGFLRLTRSSMLEILDSQFVLFARAKGVDPKAVIWKHALRNALIPVMTFAGIIFAAFITGTVVTETIFAWPGIGRLAFQAILNNDFPLISGIVMLVTAAYVLINLLVDIGYSYADPRIRY